MLYVICFLLLFVTIWIWWRKRKLSIFQRCGIPGPEPNFWIGNLKEFIEKREKCVTEYINTYGSVVGCFIGRIPVIFITDSDLLKFIQVKDCRNFNNRDPLIPDGGMPVPSITMSLPFAKDEEWKKTRCIVNRCFSPSKLKMLMPIFNESVSIFLEKIEEKAKKKEFFDIYPMFKNFTVDAITKSSFGFNTNIQHGSNSLFLDSATLCLTPDSKNILIAMSICFPELEPLPTKLRMIIDRIKFKLNIPSVSKVINVIDEMIVSRKNSAQKKNDLIQSLIDERIDDNSLTSVTLEDLGIREDKNIIEIDNQTKEAEMNNPHKNRTGLTDEAISINLSAVLVAGFDTSSTTMGFLAYYLSQRSEIQEKIRKEINEYVTKNRGIEYDDLKNFKYLNQVISETLRLHPLNEMVINRMISKTFQYKGMTFLRGTIACVPISVLHRNPEFWSNPNEFIPERFSPENKSKINQFMYQPFGNGPRNCVGMRYAQLLITFVFAQLIRSYKIESYDNKDCSIRHSLFINHPEEVKVKIVPV